MRISCLTSAKKHFNRHEITLSRRARPRQRLQKDRALKSSVRVQWLTTSYLAVSLTPIISLIIYCARLGGIALGRRRNSLAHRSCRPRNMAATIRRSTIFVVFLFFLLREHRLVETSGKSVYVRQNGSSENDCRARRLAALLAALW